MHATGTATDPLSLSDSDTVTVADGTESGTHTIRVSFMQNRVNWGSAIDEVTEGPDLASTDFSQAPGGPVTLGATFSMLRDCNIVGVRIYKAPTLAGSIPVKMWADDATELASEVVTWVSDEGGWRTIPFASPIAVVDGGTYHWAYLFPTVDSNTYAVSPWVENAQDTVVYPFWSKIFFVTGAGVRGNGNWNSPGPVIGFAPATNIRQPANYYIDPIAEWEDDMPAYVGGTAYYDQWVNGGSSFDFPIAIYFSDPPNIAGYKARGINTLIAGDVTDEYVAAVKAAEVDWYPATYGNADPPIVVQEDSALAAFVKGYQLADEPDLLTPWNSPATLRTWHSQIRHRDSTRPIYLGLSFNPVKNQGFIWQPPGVTPTNVNQEWRDYAALGDVLACDFYSLAAFDSFNRDALSTWHNRYGVWAYPAQIGRMRELNFDRAPVWGVVEITSQVPGFPTAYQIRSAVWAQLIAGARGIVFFDHRFADADVTQDFAPLLTDTALSAEITTLCAQLQALAPALLAAEANMVTDYTSSGTMVAAQGGYAAGAAVPLHFASRITDDLTYVFAQSIRAGTTVATITVPAFADATITVIDEGRTVTADSSGMFTDTFGIDYAYHLYSADTAPPLLSGTVLDSTTPLISGGLG